MTETVKDVFTDSMTKRGEINESKSSEPLEKALSDPEGESRKNLRRKILRSSGRESVKNMENKTFGERVIEEERKRKQAIKEGKVRDPLAKKLAKYVVFKPGSENGFVPLKGYVETSVEEGVIERRTPPRILDVKLFYMDKDGTNYDLLVLEIEGRFTFGNIATSGHGFLVMEGLNRRMYFFKEFNPDMEYVASKLSGGQNLTSKDMENVLLLMRIALTGGSE
jgi:hypothetical protein